MSESGRLHEMIPLKTGGILHIIGLENRKELDEIPEKDVLAIDDRNTKNPSFQVVDSYRIHNKKRRAEILDALIRYDADHPSKSKWNRTMKSLEKEWFAHNAAYRLHFFRSSARSVDLDNRDEGDSYFHFFRVGVERFFERKGWKRIKGKE